jgi:catalase (peroxidase I)
MADYGPHGTLQTRRQQVLARDFLEPIKKQYPAISYSDLWVLAGYTAIEAMGGPHGRMPFSPNLD